MIELPGELIDSTRDGQDVPFTVLVDGQVSNATNEEIDSTGNRVLEISLPTTNSVKKVEIIGTSIVPEFGSMVMIILLVSISTVFLFRNKI